MNRAARLAVVLGLAAIAAWQIDFRSVPDFFSWQQALGIAAGQPLVICGFILGALRLAVLLGRVRLVVVLKAVILSNGMNAVVPGRLSELLKISYLHDHARVPPSVSIGAILLDRVLDVILLGLTAAASVSLMMIETNSLLVAAMAAALGVLFLLPRLEGPITKICMLLPWASLQSFVRDLHQHMVDRLRTAAIYKALGYSTALWAVAALNVALFLYICGDIPIGASGVLFVFVVSIVGGTIPALPGGFGTYEAAVVFALTRYGYAAEQALPLALALHASQLLFSFTAASYLVASERLGLSSIIRQIRDRRKTAAPD